VHNPVSTMKQASNGFVGWITLPPPEGVLPGGSHHGQRRWRKVESSRKALPQQGRFLVAMRPEPATAENLRELASLLRLSPEAVREVVGGSWPRIVASRSSLEEADSLARVLTARGREAVAWDREQPLASLFQAERMMLDRGQFVLEGRGGVRRLFPANDVHRVVDLRLRLEGNGPQGKEGLFGGKKVSQAGPVRLPERAMLLVPVHGDCGVLSSQSVATGNAPVASVAAVQILQECVGWARALVPGKLVELRTTPAAMGVEESQGDALRRVLELLARLPPAPAATLGTGGP